LTRRTVGIIGSAGLLALAGAQLIRPAIPHPPVTADLAAPPEVKQILKNSCYDCHSNETRLAWFDEVVPAYWLVASDVKNGRRHLNFSGIGKLPHGQQEAALYEAVNQIQLGAMPLPAYTRLHPNAVVTPAELSALKEYLRTGTAAGAATESDLAADEAQYAGWIDAGISARGASPAPNGIEFPADYRNWQPISTTDRFDNGTMRVILGNVTAVRAIAENRIDPWPDGTTFAKVAWFARENGQGRLTPGAFFQVEFMIRDRKKYAGTLGWGWARWRGGDLKPYGKDAGFSEECVGCHTPVRGSDYVFTEPLADLRGGLAGTLPRNPLGWNAIASSIDHQASTMSTLYGNEAAVRYARADSRREYPVGSAIALVTWAERADPRWFGARIPGQVKRAVVRLRGLGGIAAPPGAGGRRPFGIFAFAAGGGNAVRPGAG
jgi:mono/diheme cytochrome c family protein